MLVSGPGTGEGQSRADEAGQQSSLPAHLSSAAVFTLALHGLLPHRFLPLHLRQMVKGKKTPSLQSPDIPVYM